MKKGYILPISPDTVFNMPWPTLLVLSRALDQSSGARSQKKKFTWSAREIARTPRKRRIKKRWLYRRRCRVPKRALRARIFVTWQRMNCSRLHPSERDEDACPLLDSCSSQNGLAFEGCCQKKKKKLRTVIMIHIYNWHTKFSHCLQFHARQ
jgi:hypothetical protein